MHRTLFSPSTFADTVQESHLRFAVLIDLIEDELAAGCPVGAHLTQLRLEFHRHACRAEEALEALFPHRLDGRRHDHDRMRALLERLNAEHMAGGDVRATLAQVVRLFTTTLMPADAEFRVSAASARQ